MIDHDCRLGYNKTIKILIELFVIKIGNKLYFLNTVNLQIAHLITKYVLAHLLVTIVSTVAGPSLAPAINIT